MHSMKSLLLVGSYRYWKVEVIVFSKYIHIRKWQAKIRDKKTNQMLTNQQKHQWNKWNISQVLKHCTVIQKYGNIENKIYS